MHIFVMFVHKDPSDNKSALEYAMAWPLISDKPLLLQMMTLFTDTYIAQDPNELKNENNVNIEHILGRHWFEYIAPNCYHYINKCWLTMSKILNNIQQNFCQNAYVFIKNNNLEMISWSFSTFLILNETWLTHWPKKTVAVILKV